MEPTFNLELNITDINTILAGLVKLTKEIADPVYDKVRNQAQQQLQAQQEPKTDLPQNPEKEQPKD